MLTEQETVDKIVGWLRWVSDGCEGKMKRARNEFNIEEYRHHMEACRLAANAIQDGYWKINSNMEMYK